MFPNLFKELFYKYLDDTMGPEELMQWRTLLQDERYTTLLNQLLEDTLAEDHSVFASGDLSSADIPDIPGKVFALIMQNTPGEKIPVRKLPFLRHWQWAAAILVLLAGAGYLALRFRPRPAAVAVTTTRHRDILPGKDGALLTLADGRQVELDSAGNGIIAMQNGTRVLLTDHHRLEYDQSQGDNNGLIPWNTMATPRGRQFNLELPDGTRIWLNAGSSISYPVKFTGTERQIEMTGEAYFEVTRNEKMPFRVKINGTTSVEVLGTHFNINAYPDENGVRTTLLEGKVTIRNKILLPGQQALTVNTVPSAISVHETDTTQAVAWKNGFFNFNNTDLEEILRQLARWYNLEVVYERKVPERRFGGEIQRNLPLSGILAILERMEVKFKVEEGRKLVVMP